MNKQALYHKSESEYCFPLDLKRVLIRFRTMKDDQDIRQINILYNMSAYFPRKHYKKKMNIVRSDELFDYYEEILNCEIPSYMYLFEIVNQNNKKSYYVETGYSEEYDNIFAGMLAFRVPFINASNCLLENKKFQGDVIYQIFPERFNFANKNKDTSYINRNWDSRDLKGKNFGHTAFLGGDLQGIYAKLDYIKDLGVDTIYLTPITASPSNHKYNVTDYFQIDPMFGSNDDFKLLVKTAHEKGLKIIMDLVFNHTSDQHPFFKDVLQKGKSSIYYDFYCMQDAPLKVDKLNYYSFNSNRYMPKVNTNNPLAQDYFIQVGEFYLNEFDVDGFRLDVANEVSHIFWIRFNQAMRKIKPDLYIIGENWDNAHEYLKAYEFDGIMNYTFFTICCKYFLGENVTSKKFVDQLNWLLTRYPNEANKMSFNLLDSHDVPRFYNSVKNNKDLYLLAILTLISYVGMPMIYYGDEIFMTGGCDPDNRQGMKWDSEEFNSPYHQLFKDIAHLRKIKVFRDGDIKINEENDLVYINRFNKNTSITVVLNKTKNVKTIDILDKKIILKNKCEINKLLPYGFVVYKN